MILCNQAFFPPIFCNLELISIAYNYHAGTDVGTLGKMCRVVRIGIVRSNLRDSLVVLEFRFQRPSSVSQCCLNTVTAKKCPAMFVGVANPG